MKKVFNQSEQILFTELKNPGIFGNFRFILTNFGQDHSIWEKFH